jgi:RimJ/RimL family protein N-acetyltransferase
MHIPTLETKRLVLRPLERGDYSWMQEKFSNWDIIRYMNRNVPWPYPDDGSKTFLDTIALKEMAEGKAFHWAICKKDKLREGIGVLSFRLYIDKADGNRGFWIEKAEQRKGYVCEACAALNDFVFGRLGWTEYRAENAAENLASRRVKEKMGAELVGTEEKEYVSGVHDTQIWRVTKDQWLKTRAITA